ncbi:hypothetical protein O181_013106 [Austropuccinia psidii MF-1]|uniref:Reverse transcriptase domain-containing protein n=1 Tax=Austropuccinia psidii MF-1 TaxID=1389203 RepID=A0A9Q3BZ18_9BASI|nr:hypothetical protein [Austropuccinia psidii MF-1]
MVVYIVNIIIYSEILEDHVQYKDRVLSKCKPINLKISLKKCNFGHQGLLELGHKVSALSLAIDKNNIEVVLQKPVPKNIKEMQSFLGFTGYYRNHIKSFSHITSSLYKLCSNDLAFEITKERRDAYERIKNELIDALSSSYLTLNYHSSYIYICSLYSRPRNIPSPRTDCGW